jgi:hypothetical protein
MEIPIRVHSAHGRALIRTDAPCLCTSLQLFCPIYPVHPSGLMTFAVVRHMLSIRLEESR